MAEYDECFLMYDMDSDLPFYGFDEVEFESLSKDPSNAPTASSISSSSPLSWVPTADQINSIKPDQAVGYWSGSVGMSGRGRSIELGRVWSGNLIGSAVGTHLKATHRFKTKYLFEIIMLVVLVSYFWFDQLICIALFVRNNDVGGGCTKYLFEIMMLVVMVSYLRFDRLICMYLFEIKMLVVIVSYFWLYQLICIAQFIYHK
ncbi:hypothetical protein DPMN_046086 [Dreissena polymorpha]|uniref:Uncharacterized protein n=1 Tax=Dreissena polymorpha TaxID=45954 RepID=A0A9D4I078_DREPO|nr:hypothetical protein DPMN_046086 [Dreissena polymorpha]